MAGLLTHIIEWLKWRIVKRELAALERYRTACAEAVRWNASIPESHKTAEWIRQQGEGESSVNIGKFRKSLGFEEYPRPERPPYTDPQ